MIAIMPFAYGVDGGQIPDAEGRSRCDAAFVAACHISRAMFVLGAGLQSYTMRFGVASLADAAANYLKMKGWPENRIIMNPEGHNTVTEVLAVRSILGNAGIGKIILVSSWWHIPRIRVIAKALLHCECEFIAARSTHGHLRVGYYVLRECAAVVRSYAHAQEYQKHPIMVR